MGRNVYKALRDYLKVRPKAAHDSVFVTQRGTPVSYHVLNKQLGFLGERTSVPNCTPHRFRHMAAVLFYRQTHDLVATKSFLRHSNVQTTMRYLKGLGVDYEMDAGYATPDEFLF
jgi:site-specific recombinase XerC